jgi:predicted TIM-barrel fold metal-dependent hydrolase
MARDGFKVFDSDADCFVFSTDYPHYDTKYPDATARFLTLPLADEAKRKTLWDNCARLYGFVDNQEAIA